MAYSHQAPRMMTMRQSRRTRTSALAMPRRRGATAGTLLVLLGIWGGIIPFVGPMFGYRMDTAGSWAFTWDRLWLNILPAAAVFFGGLILIASADRLSAIVGAWLAFAGGVWFVVGPSFSLLWGSPVAANGIGVGSDTQRFIEQIGYFYGLGAVVTALAAGAWARVMVRSVRDTALLEADSATVTDTETEARTVDNDAGLADEGYRPVAADDGRVDDRYDPTAERRRDLRDPGDRAVTDPPRDRQDDVTTSTPKEGARTEIYRDPTSSTGYRERVVSDDDATGRPGAPDDHAVTDRTAAEQERYRNERRG